VGVVTAKATKAISLIRCTLRVVLAESSAWGDGPLADEGRKRELRPSRFRLGPGYGISRLSTVNTPESDRRIIEKISIARRH
jgi:hypothetical protein